MPGIMTSSRMRSGGCARDHARAPPRRSPRLEQAKPSGASIDFEQLPVVALVVDDQHARRGDRPVVDARRSSACQLRRRWPREIPCSASAWRCSRRSRRRGCAPRRPSSPARSARSPEWRASPRRRLSSAVASRPSMPGSWMSIRIRSGCSLARQRQPGLGVGRAEHGVARRLAAGRPPASCWRGCPRRSGPSPCQAAAVPAGHRAPDLGREAVAVELRLLHDRRHVAVRAARDPPR